MAQYVFDRCLSVAATYVNDNTAKGIKAGDLAFWADQITDPSLSFTSETEEIVDARNNVVMVLQNGRGATFGASNAFFNTSILAAQTGGKVENNIQDPVAKYEIITLNNTKQGKLAHAPLDTDKAVVYALNSDGSFKTATPVAAEFEQDSLTVATGAENDKVLVVYAIDTMGTSGEHIRALADAENELLSVTAEILLRDLCDQAIYYAFLTMRGKVSGEAEWGMARDGAHAFEITAMPDYCGDKQLVDIVIVKGEDL